jgi:hypothetical protein
MLKGRKALVTGASSGLGAHFAQVLAAQGAEVTLGARRLAELQEVCAQITNGGGQARAVRLDVTDANSVAEVCAEPFDIVVNNAGISAAGPAIGYSEADWDRTMDINLKGAFLVSQAAAQKMKDNGGGSIINIASILGLRVAGAVAAYATSKAALVQLTKATALEWARYGIRVNALCPGYIETPLNTEFFATEAGQALIKRIPQRRLGRLQDLDGPLLLLASDAGAYMTGSEIAVDGGHLVSSL